MFTTVYVAENELPFPIFNKINKTDFLRSLVKTFYLTSKTRVDSLKRDTLHVSHDLHTFAVRRKRES